MHLLVITHKLFRRTPHGLQTDGALTLQLDALAAHFERVTVCVPVVDGAQFSGVAVTAPNIDFHPLPPWQGRIGFVRRLSHLRREISAAAADADLGLVIVSGYFGLFASNLCQQAGLPWFHWIVSNWSENVRARRSGVAPLGWTAWLDRWMAVRTRQTLTFYNGRILYNQGLPGQHVRTSSSIRAQDIVVRDVGQIKSPARLLFVGRLSREKGVHDLLDALAIANRAQTRFHLDIVGSGAELAGLRRQVNRLALDEAVTFHGYIAHGDALRALYGAADLFVLPALQDQQPKVLMEAMSQSVPLIATRVGGIPSVIEDGKNGLLTPPADAAALADALVRLQEDAALRARLAEAGISHVRSHTVEAETERMMAIVRTYFAVDEQPCGIR